MHPGNIFSHAGRSGGGAFLYAKHGAATVGLADARFAKSSSVANQRCYATGVAIGTALAWGEHDTNSAAAGARILSVHMGKAAVTPLDQRVNKL